MALINLTKGAIKTLLSGETQGNTKPLLQVTDISLLNSQNQYNNRERFRILLSDGSFTHEGILASQMNELVRDEKVQEGSIVMLTQFSVNLIQNRVIIYIKDLGVILEKWDLIGEPKQYPTKIEWNVPSMARATPQVQNRPSISQEMGMARTYVCKTIKQIEDEKLGTSKEPDLITVYATVAFMKTLNFCYPACPLMTADGQCNNMVTNNWYGKWRCDKCDRFFDECVYSYDLQIEIQDHTGSTWVTAYQETGEEIMGISAKDLYDMKEDEQTEEKFVQIVRNVLFTQFMFKLKVREVILGGEESIESTIVKAEKVNFGTETKYLLDQIAKLKEEDSSSLPPKNESAVNFVNTPRETGASATQKACLEPKF